MSSESNLGRLVRVSARDVWAGEATDFTPWLAGEENLSLLGETVGLELELVAQEQFVGPYRADILCRNLADDSFVLIENQLAKTDHVHLGQLMTYAAGLDAVTIVWISTRFTDEHRAALDWLNDITDEKIAFFGLEIELWRIGESPIAPKFNVVCEPNEWVKSKAGGAGSGGRQPTETQQLQQQFWRGFKDYLDDQNSKLSPQAASPQHWLDMAIGRSDFKMSAWIHTIKNQLSAILEISGPLAKPHFDALHADRGAIEGEVGHTLEWLRLPDKKSSRAALHRENFDIH
ncbi:MAG: DUF4268 domain-containing protein [Phycisphaerales bacterium]